MYIGYHISLAIVVIRSLNSTFLQVTTSRQIATIMVLVRFYSYSLQNPSLMTICLLPVVSDVTMYQRSQTYVMSTKNGFKILLSGKQIQVSAIPTMLDAHARMLWPPDLYSENAPPTEVADIINASYPLHLMHLMHLRKTRDLAEADK